MPESPQGFSSKTNAPSSPSSPRDASESVHVGLDSFILQTLSTDLCWDLVVWGETYTSHFSTGESRGSPGKGQAAGSRGAQAARRSVSGVQGRGETREESVW